MDASSPSLRDHVTAFYRQTSPFTRAFIRARWAICPFEQLVERFPSAERIAEMGCGTGLFANALACARPSAMIEAWDTNGKAVSVATSTVGTRSNIQFFVKDASSPLVPASYDAIAMIDILHHIRPEAQFGVLRGAWRALKPGGWLFFKDVNDRPRWRAWANWLHDSLQGNRPFMLKQSTVRALIAQAGFEIQDQWVNNTWYIPHVLVIARKLATSVR